jgi:mediator of replication checkpoint protein 1
MSNELLSLNISPNSPANMSSSDAGSDDEIRVPRGRAARRMLKLASSPDASPTISSRDVPSGKVVEEDLYSVTPIRRNRQTTPSIHDANSPSTNRNSTSLFVSPSKSNASASDDEELPTNLFRDKQRFAELVAQKRAEREAREAEAAEEQERNRLESRRSPLRIIEDDVQTTGSQDAQDADVDRIMSDATQPTRKASKKAMLEIERETQRMARQQALAHQMKVKKKFTMTDLLARFDNGAVSVASLPAAPVDDSSASSAPNSDASEPQSVRRRRHTPPSSPPTPLDRQRALVERGALSKLMPARQDSLASLAQNDDSGDELLDMAELLSSSRRPKSPRAATEEASKPGLKLARLGKTVALESDSDSADDELEIIHQGVNHHRIFDQARSRTKRQNTDSRAIHTLKHLSRAGADVNRVSRRRMKSAKPIVLPHVLEAQLRARAQEQARMQQLERVAELKSRGVVILSAEDRDKEAEDLENLLEKARQDALKLRKSERKGLQTNEDGKIVAVASDDEDEDEDYEGSEMEDEIEDESDGQEDELIDDAADEDEEDDVEDGLDEEAEGSTNGELEAEDSAIAQIQEQSDDEEAVQALQSRRQTTRQRKSRVVLDDEDEEHSASSQVRSQTPLRTPAEDPFAAFGFGNHNPGSSLMSPTQAFHATMQTPSQLTQQDSMEVFNRLAPPTVSSMPPVPSAFEYQTQYESQTSVVPASQSHVSQQIQLPFEMLAPQTPISKAKRSEPLPSIVTPGWEPTQDDGLPNLWQATANLRREDTLDSVLEQSSTQDTVAIRIAESPAPAKLTRLVRGQRREVMADDSDEDEAEQVPGGSSKNAFREMSRKRKEALTAAERAEAEMQAKNMMDEQADESDDEYAGLGGDDFVAPETEQDHDIIDSSHIEVDEQALAAHYAERQRIEDEANANKLFKDLTTGALRRKQANMFDLDEDEADVALRRRQMRQQEEARRRRLLLQDDGIANLAHGKQSKGKDAFLKAIADDDDAELDDDDMLDIEGDAERVVVTATPENDAAAQSQQTIAPLQEISGNKRRREGASTERLPATKRRTQVSAFRAPASLLEIKESLSFLLEEPNALVTVPVVDEVDSGDEHNEDDEAQEFESDSEDEVEAEKARQNDGGFAPDRVMMPSPARLPATQRRTAANAVIDRLSMKRGASNTDALSNGPSAWASPLTSGGGLHGIPSLLRRATTNTAFAANERGVTTSAGGSTLSRENSTGSNAGSTKMGGSKKSSLAYQARAEERRVIVEAGVRQRAENTRRIAEMRRSAGGVLQGRGFGGSFE